MTSRLRLQRSKQRKPFCATSAHDVSRRAEIGKRLMLNMMLRDGAIVRVNGYLVEEMMGKAAR